MKSVRRRPERWLARRGGAVELLRLPAALFGAGASLRGHCYDRGWLAPERVDAPVISVGNLSAGGTGKTPFVHLLARELLARGERPGIVSRGYGSRDGENDESRLAEPLRRAGALTLESPDRAAGARRLVEQGATVIVLDDGFQHRRLGRDLDLVLIDATRPWGLPGPPEGGAPVRALLPRGLLRERPAALARADALVVTRVDQVSEELLQQLEEELERLAPGVGRLHARHRPVGLRRLDGSEEPLESLAGREIDLASGIGNPEAFARTLEALGATVARHRVFADHHPFRAADLAGLGAGGRWLVTTAKDAVKWEGWRPDALVLEVELEIVRGRPLLAALLDGLPRSQAARRRAAIHGGLHG